MKAVSEENEQKKGEIQIQYRIFIKLCELLKKSDYLTGLELKLKNEQSLNELEIKKLKEMLEESSKTADIISSFSLFYEKDDDFQVLEKHSDFIKTILNKDLDTLQTLFNSRLNELEC